MRLAGTIVCILSVLVGAFLVFPEPRDVHAQSYLWHRECDTTGGLKCTACKTFGSCTFSHMANGLGAGIPPVVADDQYPVAAGILPTSPWAVCNTTVSAFPSAG